MSQGEEFLYLNLIAIIAVTEVFPKHRIDNIAPAKLSTDGYDLFFNDFSSRHGVCLLCKTVYQAVLVVELNNINFDEFLWCSVHLKNKDCLFIGVVYYSPT